MVKRLGKILHLSAIVRKENPMYVSWCPELNVASQGKTIEDAISNLREAVELYIADEDAFIPKEIWEDSAQTPILLCLDVKP